jgi:D-psicose/D-tagatose/L-ribulose 3-epimerase
MKIGFNLLLWTTHVLDEHMPTIEALKKTGYDGIEVPILQGKPTFYAALGRRLDDLGLARTCVSVIPSVDLHPIGTPEQASEGYDYMRNVLDCAAALKAELVCGPLHSTLGYFTGSGPMATEKDRAVAFHLKVGDHAKSVDIPIVLEPLNRFECYFMNTLESAKAHLDRVRHSHIQAMYDSFHANIEEKELVGVLPAYRQQIAHIHISENDRGTPGRGHIDFASIFAALRAIGYDRWLTIEAFGRGLPELAAATKVWRDFFPDPKQVYEEGFRLIRDGWPKAA